MHPARASDINLAYYTYGQGSPVLMIQGLGGRAADLGSVPDRMAQRFRVVTFDNRGTGKSDKPDEEYKWPATAIPIFPRSMHRHW